ncbi:DUF4296 domain-containing protein [Balneolaceae bacterium YR4-1]|uniref:DUF4296 domain-containing protein n=1 Tax=Halalkalibaculum roseum TaxID=2709311 RepID=A0A6M1SXS7_9BACT|nr:DUF4296 domain-containing protein [Halalkalibaculum roseum]NGP77078.1 DUF4296 domain-containing protein [Halalkalibaculum roseum]
MSRTILSVIFVFVVFWFAGCNQNSSPSAVIGEEKYIDLMVELQLFRSYIRTVPSDSATIDSLQTEIFNKYNVTREEFRKSHQYYQQQYVQQKERIDRAIEQLRMDQVQSDSTRPWEQNANR